MEQKFQVTQCPICYCDQFHDVMNLKDNMITQEHFTIQECNQCGFWFTNPRPSLKEIGRYYKSENYISHSSTQKGFVNKIYNLVRNRTLVQKRKLIESLTDKRNLLDIGSGTGHFVNECTNNGWNVIGLEPDIDARKFSANHFNNSLFPLEHLSLQEQESFNVVTMWHVLEHVYNLREDLKQITSLICKEGYLVIAVPNRESFDAFHYKEFWAAYDVPRHLSHFSEKNMIQLIEQFGMKYVSTLPMKYDSFYVSMLSEKYLNGSLMNAFNVGLKSNRKAHKDGNYSSKIYIFKK